MKPPTGRLHGIAAVWRLELLKCFLLIRVQVVALSCLVVPFLVAAAVKAQSSLPSDTLFGQWLHESGFALPMVILGFAGQWVLPLLTVVVSGDIFSSEDHFGTWKTVLTRSRSRGDLFAGKALAATTYSVAMLVLLASASLLAGSLLGTAPLVGLTGQLVAPTHATVLVLASWASSLPPVMGFGALGVLLSVVTRSSPIGIGVPVLLGLLMQVASLVDLPSSVRVSLLGTAFSGWHGLWVQDPFYGPLWAGCLTSAVWFGVCGGASWLVFRRRDVSVS